MSATAKKTDPALWEKVKKEVTESDKGGKPGQWSARKAQAATKAYKDAGGGYAGKKSSDNHLTEWTEEKWDTKSGEKSGETGERYLPKAAREKLSDAEYDRSTKKKRAITVPAGAKSLMSLGARPAATKRACSAARSSTEKARWP